MRSLLVLALVTLNIACAKSSSPEIEHGYHGQCTENFVFYQGTDVKDSTGKVIGQVKDYNCNDRDGRLCSGLYRTDLDQYWNESCL